MHTTTLSWCRSHYWQARYAGATTALAITSALVATRESADGQRARMERQLATIEGKKKSGQKDSAQATALKGETRRLASHVKQLDARVTSLADIFVAKLCRCARFVA